MKVFRPLRDATYLDTNALVTVFCHGQVSLASDALPGARRFADGAGRHVLPQPPDNNHRPHKLGLLVMIGLQATICPELARVGSAETTGEHCHGGRLKIFTQTA